MKRAVLLVAGMFLLALWGCSECRRAAVYWCDPVQQTDKVTVTTPDGQWTTTLVEYNFSPSDAGLYTINFSPQIGLSIEGDYPDKYIDQPDHYFFYIAIDFDRWKAGDVIDLTEPLRIKNSMANGIYKDYLLKDGKIDSGTLKVVKFSQDGVQIKLENLKISGVPWNRKVLGPRVQWQLGTLEYTCRPKVDDVCQDPY